VESFANVLRVHNIRLNNQPLQPVKLDKHYLKLLIKNIAEDDDQQALGKLFKLLYERLVNFSKNYVQSRELAEEIVSDVFVKLWNNRKQCSSILDPEAYLYVAVKNQSLNNISKTAKSFVEIGQAEAFDITHLIEAFDPERELEIQELQHNINVAIDTLPPQCKAIFKMIKDDGFKYKEVADILEISPRTVETQLVRALKRLDLALAPYVAQKIKKKTPKQSTGVFNLRSLLLGWLL
jgi:RNA polymerase sigma-70 factor (family 1)